ncbi:MAG: hypothetical protein H6595_01445 [Flavobacteriales bacterium]|nr:hypothetical protein [Flavobacteriales bacterium]MCB9166124.1 hypothetical protein [Flavobacteriales bacterium]
MKRDAYPLLGLAMLLLSACRTDVLPPVVVQDDDGAHVFMHTEIQQGNQSLSLGTTYHDAANTAFRYTTVKFFLGRPTLIDAAEDTLADLPGAYVLFDASDGGVHEIGRTRGYVHRIKFGLGVDHDANHADPTLAMPPLNDASMHWGWNTAQGYKFFVIEGQYDQDGDGMPETSFTYHCATDPEYRVGEAVVDIDASDVNNVNIQMRLDMQAVMNGLDIAARPVVVAPDTLTDLLMDRLQAHLIHL